MLHLPVVSLILLYSQLSLTHRITELLPPIKQDLAAHHLTAGHIPEIRTDGKQSPIWYHDKEWGQRDRLCMQWPNAHPEPIGNRRLPPPFSAPLPHWPCANVDPFEMQTLFCSFCGFLPSWELIQHVPELAKGRGRESTAGSRRKKSKLFPPHKQAVKFVLAIRTSAFRHSSTYLKIFGASLLLSWSPYILTLSLALLAIFTVLNQWTELAVGLAYRGVWQLQEVAQSKWKDHVAGWR